MTIYIESFLLQNLLINFCLLRLVYLTTKSGTKFYKMLISSIFATFFSVLGAIFIKNVIILNIIKFLSAIIMIRVAFKCSKKQFVFNFILLFIYTYALGGIVTTFAGTSYLTSFGVVISSKINLNIVAICVITLSYIFELVVKHIKFKINTNNLIYPITLYKDKNKVKLFAYLDTGNLLNYNNSPVIVIDLNSYLKLTNKNLIDYFVTPGEYAKTATVNGNSKLKIEKIDKLEICVDGKNKIYNNQFVAVSNSFKNTNYQALLNPSLF